MKNEMEMLKKKQTEKQTKLKKLKPKSRKLKKADFKNRLKNVSVKTTEEIEAWERKNKEAAPALMPMVLDLFKNCDEDDAAMPNTIARSALFTPTSRGRRRYIDNEIIASRKDIEIKFIGQQLDMGDADVFLMAIKLADQKKLGIAFQIRPYKFLNDMGRATGKANFLWLQKSFERLSAGNVRIETNRFIAVLSLLDEYIYDKNTGNHYLKFNPKIITLFRQEQYALINWKKRKKIEIDLSKWLQTCIASNAKGTQKISLKKLQGWCGKESMRDDKFKNTLLKALQELKKLKIIKNFNLNNKEIIEIIRL